MVPSSMGWGAVYSGILQGGWGTRQGAPQGSGGDAHQEGVVIHTPIGQEGGTWVDQRSVALISDPEVHHPPIGSGADGVDHPIRVGIKTVVDGGDGFEDGHRIGVGCLWYCSRWRGQASTHPPPQGVTPRRSCPPGTGAAAHGCRSHSRGDGRGRSSHGCGAAPPARAVPPTVRWSRGR